MSATRTHAGRLIALLLAVLLFVCAGCASPAQQGGDATQAEAESSDTQQQEEPAAEDEAPVALGRTSGDAALDAWADECLDRRGDITVYAISELKGGQLNALMQEQDYAWNERNQIWLKEDGSAAVVACNKDGEHLTADEMAKLSSGSSEAAVSYRIVTSGYNSFKKAFEGLAEKVMTCEDVCYAEDGAVGIVSGPSARRSLVLVSTSNDVYAVSVFSEDAVAEGLLDKATGQSLGKSVDGAFEKLSGRKPGEEK